ncbi:MAG: DUF1800 domain-containing protein [Bacteroidetes bacterium]|nr:MAG: DUF1800 domain-containing protein [Bacteroidota bacterium]REK08092.1 MAG: DUF1800 domain-containing protein [Bacteroidota bacterium]REK32297.1 MAG: DUF1800 domain-containing protein [Bacteroidota bacterium]REK49531.1 MAG: DUF1800 domain-containing protein [Bacteroidota bacterium]
MDRREFITQAIPERRQKQDFSGMARTITGLSPYTGPWTINEVRHLLKRTMFGASIPDMQYFLSLNTSSSVAELLEQINHPPYNPPQPPLNNYDATSPDANCPFGQAWPGTPDTLAPVSTVGARRRSLKSWWIGLQLNQSRSLREKMVLFWHNHFVVELDTISVGTYNYKYNELLRLHALGNFKTLVREITTNSTMLKYLNGEQNTAAAPNENYARELQELFTVGKNANGTPPYTEDDVIAAARVLTGWRNDLSGGVNSANGFNSYFDPSRHDSGNKQFSTYYNNTVITGRSGAAGATETDDLLDMIFQKDDVALNLCRKLYKFFIYYEIDAAAENDVIQPLANIFRNSNYEIAPVLSALFNSEHFFDFLNMGCLIKGPLDTCIGLLREFNVQFPSASDLAAQYAQWDRMRSQGSTLQQNLGNPPNVAGWPAYYQEPLFHELWINSDTLPKRNQFTDRILTSGYTNLGTTIKVDVLSYTASLTNPGDPLQLIEEVLALHYSIDVSVNVRNHLLSILLSGQALNSYWTTAWDDYTGDPTNTSYATIVRTRLETFYKYILSLSEYQLS